MNDCNWIEFLPFETQFQYQILYSPLALLRLDSPKNIQIVIQFYFNFEINYLLGATQSAET